VRHLRRLRNRSRRGTRADPAALAQGVYFLASGLWPIVHYRSFEAVSGRKVDGWLVKTMGGLIAAVGASLLASSTHSRRHASTRALGAGTASALAASDMVYVIKRRISPVYLIDAAVELALAALWMTERRKRC
jgi:hypothetical protein